MVSKSSSKMEETEKKQQFVTFSNHFVTIPYFTSNRSFIFTWMGIFRIWRYIITSNYSRLFNSSGARRLFFGKFSTEYKLITVATIIDFCIVSQPLLLKEWFFAKSGVRMSKLLEIVYSVINSFFSIFCNLCSNKYCYPTLNLENIYNTVLKYTKTLLPSTSMCFIMDLWTLLLQTPLLY